MKNFLLKLLIILAVSLFIKSDYLFSQPGSLDCSFGNAGIETIDFEGFEDDAHAIAFYESGIHEGKILVAGNAYGGESTPRQFGVVRLLADGSVDNTFGTSGKVTVQFSGEYDYCKDVVIQSDGKIILAGYGNTSGNYGNLAVARLDDDGSLDNTFSGDGKYYIHLGSTNRSNYINAVKLQSDGKIVVAGQVSDNSAIVRIAADGSSHEGPWEVSLNNDGCCESFNDLDIQSDGKIVATGYADFSGNINKMSVVRFNSDGTLDTGFDSDGILEVTFNGDGGSGYGVIVQSDGKIVIGGTAEMTDRFFSVVRLNSDGSYDNTFSSDGRATVDINGYAQGNGVALQSDGKIIVGAYANGNYGLARFNTDGTLDNTFGTNGTTVATTGGWEYPYGLAINPDGKVFTVGTTEATSTRDFAIFSFLTESGDMEYCCGNTEQNTEDIFPGTDGVVLQVSICTPGDMNPLDVSAFTFNTNGSTNPGGDIESATLYYTGNSNEFSTTSAFGSSASAPNGSFSFSGLQTLSGGANYFWLVYTLKPGATLGNVIDGECTNYTISGATGTVSPDITSPSGSKTIVEAAYQEITLIDPGDNAYNWITNVTFNTINNTSGQSGSSNSTGYTDYTSTISTDVDPGSNYTLSVTIYAEGYWEHIRAYFDWNQDYDFLDTGEEIILLADNTTTGSVSVSDNITIPLDAKPGSTRMRITTDDNEYYGGFVANGNVDYGEAEDYGLNISTPCVNPDIPSISASKYSICPGGSSTISITSGNLNEATEWYWYSGSCGGTSVGTGTTIVVTPESSASYYVRGEGGCVTPGSCATVTITVPDTLEATAIADSNVSCYGYADGGASVTVTGGTAPFKYSWSTTDTTSFIIGLAPAEYTVTVTDANLCTSESSVTITEPTVLVASAVVDSNVSCYGYSDGGATASATGGTESYSYSWSNGGTTASLTGLEADSYTVTITDANGCTSLDSIIITEPTELITSIVTDSSVSCNGYSDGEATVTATGSVPSYTYSWSNGDTTASVSGLSVDSYSVTVTDANGCTSVENITVTEPDVLEAATVVNNNASCYGYADGSATASATGGTSPYKYSWSNSDTTAVVIGLSADMYSVTVTDNNGCTSVSDVTITDGPSVNLTLTVDSSASCSGISDGGASVSASGGTGPYTYLWSNGDTIDYIAGVEAGTYSVTVTDVNDCYSTDDIEIENLSSLVITTSIDNSISCPGGNDGVVSAAISGGTAPYSYSWSTGDTTSSLTGLSAGEYTITITDVNMCNDSKSITLNAANDETNPEITCAGNQELSSDSCNVPLPDYTNTVVVNDNCTATGNLVITQDPVAGTLVDDDLTVSITVEDESGNTDYCSFNVSLTNVCEPEGLKDPDVESFYVFPNPANDFVNVNTQVEGTIVLTNSNGQIIDRYYTTGKDFKIDVNYLRPGIYILIFKSDDFTANQKLIIK